MIETKGYPGGTVTEGGTAIHSFYNLWKAFPGVEKRQVVKGIPSELIDRLMLIGATTGQAGKYSRAGRSWIAQHTEILQPVRVQSLQYQMIMTAVTHLVWAMWIWMITTHS